MLKNFEKVYIEKASLDSDSAKRALRVFPKHRINVINDKSELKNISNMSARQFDQSKKKPVIMSF